MCGRRAGGGARTLEEQRPGLIVRSDALQQRQRVADAVGGVRRERRRGQEGVNGDDFLKQHSDGPEAVPQVGCQLRKVLSLLAEFE